jgi:histidinol-phosphate aminotransferase
MSESALPFLKNALDGVQKLSPYEPGMPIEELQRRLGVANAVKLASNENPLGVSAKVRAALEAASKGDLARYPDGSGYRLKQKLAKLHGVAPEQITLGNGSNDIFAARTRGVSAGDPGAERRSHRRPGTAGVGSDAVRP